MDKVYAMGSPALQEEFMAVVKSKQKEVREKEEKSEAAFWEGMQQLALTDEAFANAVVELAGRLSPIRVGGGDQFYTQELTSPPNTPQMRVIVEEASPVVEAAAASRESVPITKFTVEGMRSREQLKEFSLNGLRMQGIMGAIGLRFLLLNQAISNTPDVERITPIVDLRSDGLYFFFHMDGKEQGKAIGESLIDMFGGKFSSMNIGENRYEWTVGDATYQGCFVVKNPIRILQLLVLLGLEKDEVASLCKDVTHLIVRQLEKRNGRIDWDQQKIEAYVEQLRESFKTKPVVTPLPYVKESGSVGELRDKSSSEITNAQIRDWLRLHRPEETTLAGNPDAIRSYLECTAIAIDRKAGILTIQALLTRNEILEYEVKNHSGWKLEMCERIFSCTEHKHKKELTLVISTREAIQEFLLRCGVQQNTIRDFLTEKE